MSPVRTVGALQRWQAELAAGMRTLATTDRLWRAACREAMAADFDRLGLPTVADKLRRESARIVLGARETRGRVA